MINAFPDWISSRLSWYSPWDTISLIFNWCLPSNELNNCWTALSTFHFFARIHRSKRASGLSDPIAQNNSSPYEEFIISSVDKLFSSLILFINSIQQRLRISFSSSSRLSKLNFFTILAQKISFYAYLYVLDHFLSLFIY